MAIVNLLDLEVNKASSRIEDYSLMIVAPSSFGKSPFLAELYGERALFLGFENSYKGITGVYTVPIDSYTTLEAYLAQLENPQLKAKFDIIVIDTLFLLDKAIESSITSSYGKDTIGDCRKYNGAYQIVDKKFLSVIKRIQRLGYTLAYVCHPADKKVKINGQEITRIEPQVSDRIKNLLLPEVDIKLVGGYDESGNKVLYTQGTAYFDARVRGADIPPVIPFDANILREVFSQGVISKHGADNVVSNLAQKDVVSDTPRSFEEAMKELVSLGEELGAKGLGNEANMIVARELGVDDDGKQRTLQNLNEFNIDTVETIIVKLKAVKDKMDQ